MWMKRTLIILPIAGIALFLVGGHMQRMHGLDPPYWVFFTGFAFQLVSFGIAIIAAILLVVAGIRAWL